MTYVDHPGLGVAVLACRCGKMLDSADMCRRRHPAQTGAAAAVERITCAGCADVAVPLGRTIASVIRDFENNEGDGIVVWSKGRAS